MHVTVESDYCAGWVTKVPCPARRVHPRSSAISPETSRAMRRCTNGCWIRSSRVSNVCCIFMLAGLPFYLSRGNGVLFLSFPCPLAQLPALLRVRRKDHPVFGTGGNRHSGILVAAAHDDLPRHSFGERALQFRREVQLL